MAVTWNITNLEYTNDSDKGVVHAAWSATNSEVVGEVTQAQYRAWSPIRQMQAQKAM